MHCDMSMNRILGCETGKGVSGLRYNLVGQRDALLLMVVITSSERVKTLFPATTAVVGHGGGPAMVLSSNATGMRRFRTTPRKCDRAVSS